MNEKYIINENIIVRDDAVLFDINNNIVLEFNEIGFEIIKGIISNKSIDEIINDLLNEYDSNMEEMSGAVLSFIEKCLNDNIVRKYENI